MEEVFLCFLTIFLNKQAAAVQIKPLRPVCYSLKIWLFLGLRHEMLGCLIQIPVDSAQAVTERISP